MRNFRRFAALLVGFGGAFYTLPIGGVSVGFLCAGIYFVLMIPLLSGLSHISQIYGGYYKLPLIYLLIVTVLNLFYLNISSDFFPTSCFLCWLLFALILLHSLSDNKAPSFVMTGFSLGTIVLATLFYLGIGVESTIAAEGERFTMYGANSNIVGIMQCFGFIIILNSIVLQDTLKIKSFRLLFIIPLISQVGLILATGSRTAFVILFVILVLSVVFVQTKKRYSKYLFVLAGLISLYLAMKVFLASDLTILARILTSTEQGNTSGRTDIWLTYLKLFPQHPIFGSGTIGFGQLAKTVGLTMSNIEAGGSSVVAYSPHNVLIEVLMTSGIVGLWVMVKFWYSTIQSAYVGFKITKNTTAMLLIIPIAIVMLSGQLLIEKYAWFAYAYMITSARISDGCANSINNTKSS